MKTGYFPKIEDIVSSVMDEISLLMDEFPNVESDAWSIIFQSNNPGTNCPKTTKFINKRTK